MEGVIGYNGEGQHFHDWGQYLILSAYTYHHFLLMVCASVATACTAVFESFSIVCQCYPADSLFLFAR